MSLRSIIEVPGDATVKPSPGGVWFDNDAPINRDRFFVAPLHEGGGEAEDITRDNRASIIKSGTASVDWALAGGRPAVTFTPGSSSSEGAALNFGLKDRYRVTGAFTLSAWVYRTGTTTDQGGIIARYLGSGNNRSYMFTLITGNYVRVTVTKNGQFDSSLVDSSTAIPANTWTHVACVYVPGTRLTIYINGIQDAENTTSIITSVYGGAAELWVGNTFSISDLRTFPGSVDVPSGWSRALTLSEMRQLHHKPFAGLVAPRYVPVAAAAAAGGATIPRHSINALQHGFSGHPIASLSGGLAA